MKTIVESNKEERKNASLSSDSFTSDKSLVIRNIGGDDSLVSNQPVRMTREMILQQLKDKAEQEL